ncbi:SpoIIE family protein phosphatase [Parvibium lacunae]|uniref:PPM-type phosphatase domain-containing protein n=1 Tax=Parvibium lacunae TaxID=1888893 RepID=A0A368L7A7_9BURK|nr:SpoIIE family protein phosphatase [Parvibium lacunae]RCS59506.1 hypothetical protein DU000_01895 [Parvibium lacunae]
MSAIPDTLRITPPYDAAIGATPPRIDSGKEALTKRSHTLDEVEPVNNNTIDFLVKPIALLPGSTRVLALHDKLIQHPDTQCVAIAADEQVTGLIYCRQFLKRMSEPYQRELNERKLLSDIAETGYFSLQASETITTALEKLLAHDPRLKLDAVPIFRDTKLIGQIAIPALILAISRNQTALYQQLAEMSQRLHSEVSKTAALQAELLPAQQARLDNIEIASQVFTSTEVGGDFFDYFVLDQNHIGIAIGDASGHGVPAGMLVSAAKGALHALPTETRLNPAVTLQQLNQAILATGMRQLLMTFCYGVINTQDLVFEYANAGHNFPYWLRNNDNTPLMLDTEGEAPLGLDNQPTYQIHSVRLQAGDKLFFYTDGLIENTNTQEEEFGYERLESHLTNFAKQTSTNLVKGVASYASQHFQTHKPDIDDDVTLLCIEVAAPAQYQQRQSISIGVADFELRTTTIEQQLQQTKLPFQRLSRQHIAMHDLPSPTILTQHFFNANFRELVAFKPGQSPILLTARSLSKQISLLRNLGVLRLIQEADPIIDYVGWPTLLLGHIGDEFINLHQLCQPIRFYLSQTADKEITIQQLIAAMERAQLAQTRPEIIEIAALIADELLENAFMASSKRHAQPYAKGQDLVFQDPQGISLALGCEPHLIAIQISDDGGNFDGDKLLERLQRNLYGVGVQSHASENGMGGAGLYMVWRLADYLHIHIAPGKRTSITVFFHANGIADDVHEKSVQITYQASN